MRYDAVESVADVVKRIKELERAYLLKAPDVAASLGSAIETIAAALSVELDELALEIKNPIFHDEFEWRLVYEVRRGLLGPNETIVMAIRDNYPKAYVELKFQRPQKTDVTKTPPSAGTEAIEMLPITEIICGPKLDQALATYSVQTLLSSTGYHGVRVNPSTLHQSVR